MVVARSKREAMRKALPPGYSLRQARDNHFNVIRPDGSFLRTETGMPVKVSASPSCRRAAKNFRAVIRRLTG